MKLVAKTSMTAAETHHAVPADEAVRVFRRFMENHESLEGLAELLRGLPTSFDSDVIDQLKTGEWRLIDDQAYGFDWGLFNDKMDQHKRIFGDGAMLEQAKIIVGHAICPMTSFRKEPIRRKDITHGLEEKQEAGHSGNTGIIECSHDVHTEAMTVQLTD